MKHTWLILGAAVVGGVVGGSLVIHAQYSAYGSMPLLITTRPIIKVLGGTERLGHLVGVVQRTQAPGAGPQALEGYTLVDHPGGVVTLALGVIGNIELAGAGDTTLARALTGGVVVSGPGVVRQASSLTLTGVTRHSAYTGPVNVERTDYVTFGNGWSIRPNGAQLLICDPQSACRPF